MSERRLGLIKRPSSGFAFNNALDFDGVNDYVLLNSAVSLGSTFTVSHWFYKTDTSVDIFLYHSVNQYTAFINSTVLRYKDSIQAEFTVPTMSISTWYNVVWSASSGTLKCYLNGVESTSGGKSITGNLIIGRIAYYTSANFFGGKFDDLGMKIGYAASQADVTNLYNGGAGADFNSIIGSSDLYYHFDESDPATTLVDSSGNGNNGTLNNFTVPNFVTH